MSFKQAFDLFDVDHSGAIDDDELYQAMKAIGLRTSKKECSKMINDQDEDGNGEIDFPEFLEMMKIKMVSRFFRSSLTQKSSSLWKTSSWPGIRMTTTDRVL